MLFHRYKNIACLGLALVTMSFGPVLAQDSKYDADAIQTGSVAPIIAAPTPLHHVVVLDPGHGGGDPGATGLNGVTEKDVVLAFAKVLKATLEQTGQYDVRLTRDGDSFMKLEDRVKLAREAKAELFIALHADRIEDASVRGTTIFTVSDKASDAEAARLAQVENGSDTIAGLDLSHQTKEVASALVTLAQRESQSDALIFAHKAMDRMRLSQPLVVRPLRSGAFVVLKAPDVPSVLVELGFLSSPIDASLLTSDDWRKEMAEALAGSVAAYFTSPATASAQ